VGGTTRQRRRGTGGFRSAGALVDGDLRRAGESRGFAVARLLTHWPEIVGPDLAAAGRPVKVSYAGRGSGATLTVLTTGARAPLLQMQAEHMRARINACYGYAAIARIRLVQTSPAALARAEAPPPPPGPTPADAARAADLAASVRDPDLRAALSRLGANVLARSARRAAPPATQP